MSSAPPVRKTLAPPEALRILEDATAGLTHAFSRGVTHRDIKLTNLLISSQGEAKLTDFGLAQLMASMAAKDDEKVDRTVDYAGLEKATGAPHGDTRSDIFFLGCVAFQLLTGRLCEFLRRRHGRSHEPDFLEQPAEHHVQLDRRAVRAESYEPERASPVEHRAHDDALGEQAGRMYRRIELLSVIGNVYQQASDGGRHRLLAYSASLGEVLRAKSTYPLRGIG